MVVKWNILIGSAAALLKMSLEYNLVAGPSGKDT
jgi:hypothetical protein